MDYSKYTQIKNHQVLQKNNKKNKIIKIKHKIIKNNRIKLIQMKIKYKIYLFLEYLPPDKVILEKMTLLKKIRIMNMNINLKVNLNTKCLN